MDELFGVPLAGYAIVLAAILAVLVGLLAYVAIRTPILVKMAVRNVVRRPARGLLIVTGLMLATAIISIAFTMGDSVTFSIKGDVTDALRELDEYVAVDESSEFWQDGAVPETFPESLYAQLGPAIEADKDVAATLPVLSENVALANLEARQFEVNALIVGIDAGKAESFERLTDIDGQPIEIGSLGPNEVYIDAEGAEQIAAETGDVIQIVLGEDLFVPFTIRGVSDGYYWGDGGAGAIVMAPLARVQELLGAQGQISAIMVSNRGDAVDGADRSAGVMERLEDLPAIRQNGLEIVPIKSDLLDFANAAGSLFVSFFTTFGLFSIGVGLLLIFLIFSMLAAERKGEMGMARAVGMQRNHLTRMFLTEGAIYGLGSAAVGSLAGVGLGLILVRAASNLFAEGPESLVLKLHASPLSALTAFLFGAVITLLTVYFASRRISRLNIVRAIRDIPEPPSAAGGWRDLAMALALLGAGVLIVLAGVATSQLPAMMLGVALLPLGSALLMRWVGIPQRAALSLAGLSLIVVFAMPDGVWNLFKDDWSDNFASFFIVGAFLVTGAVMLVMNNSRIVLLTMANTIGRYRRLTPVVKSAVAYPMRFGFRTGLSVAMFAVVIFSVVVMMILIAGFNVLFGDQERLAGGYDVYGFVRSDLNPIEDLSSRVESDPALALVASLDGKPHVGTIRTIFAAEGHLPDYPPTDPDADERLPTFVTGVDRDFISSNNFEMLLATPEYVTDDGFDAERLWADLANVPGLAVVDAEMLNSLNSFAVDIATDRLRLDVPNLYQESETMDPVRVAIRDLDSGRNLELTVVGVIDDFASFGPIPMGLYTSSEFLTSATGRQLEPTQYFFKVDPGIEDPAGKLETALFAHSVETLDMEETIREFQGSQRSFFDLLMAFMLLGLVVGIASLGVISARAVVERRHAIGVMRAVGFSRREIWLTFIAESSFIGLLGIAIGVILGIITGINIIESIRAEEPTIRFVFPWQGLVLVTVGAYLFSLLTTLLPARQASLIAPAEALRYE